MKTFRECFDEALSLAPEPHQLPAHGALFLFDIGPDQSKYFRWASDYLKDTASRISPADMSLTLPVSDLSARFAQYRPGRLDAYRGQRFLLIAVQDGVPQVAQDFLESLLPRDGRHHVMVFA